MSSNAHIEHAEFASHVELCSMNVRVENSFTELWFEEEIRFVLKPTVRMKKYACECNCQRG